MAAWWIKISTNIVNWEWYNEVGTRTLFLHLLIIAKTAPVVEKGVQLSRGQCITTVAELAKINNLSVQQTKNKLKNLQTTNNITIKATNKFSIITICKYGYWQGVKNVAQQMGKQTNQQTDNKQINNQTTNANNVYRVIDNNRVIDNTHTTVGIDKEGGAGGDKPLVPDETVKKFANVANFIDKSPATAMVRQMESPLTAYGVMWLFEVVKGVTVEDMKRVVSQMNCKIDLSKDKSVVQTMRKYLDVDMVLERRLARKTKELTPRTLFKATQVDTRGRSRTVSMSGEIIQSIIHTSHGTK